MKNDFVKLLPRAVPSIDLVVQLFNALNAAQKSVEQVQEGIQKTNALVPEVSKSTFLKSLQSNAPSFLQDDFATKAQDWEQPEEETSVF